MPDKLVKTPKGEIMTKMEFVTHYCGTLEENQRIMTEYAIDNDFLYGVGRAIGRMAFMPLISKNGKTFDVIDGAGYNQLSPAEGRIGFTYHYED